MDWPPQSWDLNIIAGSSWQQRGERQPKKSFGCPSRSLENYSWGLLKSLLRNIQAVLKNKDAWYTLFPSMFGHIPINQLTHFPFSQQNRKKWRGGYWLLYFTPKQIRCSSSFSDLVFDILSHWSLPQLRRGPLCDAEWWRYHLSAWSVHTDKMDEAWEILQVSEINQLRLIRSA